MARKPPNLRQKLASALLMMVQPDDTGKMVPVIPFARAMKMTADQIISEFDFDHAVYVAIGGGNEPWNLVPRLRAAHREKTKRDLANIAKVKRGIKKRAAKAATRPLDKHGYPTGEDMPLAPGENPIADAQHQKAVDALMRKARKDHLARKKAKKIPSRPFPTKQERQAAKARFAQREMR